MGIQYKPGASLRVWKDYFSNATIYGADIDKNILFEEERIKTFEVDQLNKYSIQKMWDNIKEDNFDLIIDDGLHTYEAGVILFNNSYSMLREGGLYIIEDVHPSYLYKLSNFFIQNYNTEVITLKSNLRKLLEDNNIILIRKK
jgi:23S rRNA U2552 (ribose-2'-O)-methylase RlmE/FtsJ